MRSFCIAVLCLALFVATATAQPAAKGTRDAEISDVATAWVLQKTANLGSEMHIRRVSILGNPVLPEGPLDYEVVAPPWEGWGPVNMAVIARQGDRIVRNISVRVEVEALAEMVVTVRQIDHGSVLSAADLALRKQDVAPTQGRYLRKIEDAIGKKTRATLKANAAVKSEQLEKVPLVKSGQIVTIVAENERMRITVTGKAKGTGAEGDTIVVQNLGSLKEMPARILDANTVVVVF